MFDQTRRQTISHIRSLAGTLLAMIMVFSLSLQPALAQQRGVAVVRDAEIEALVRDYAAPVLKAAGLARAGVEIILVNDLSFNAFVSGRRIFINAGALLMSETPNEIIGVIAHEAGHIAGGHQLRLRQRLENAKAIATVASLLGVGAIAAGASTGNSDIAQIGSGIVAGGPELARRGLLAYQRDEESSADRSAMTYLNATGQSGRGMIKTLERLGGSLDLSGNRINPYTISHPLPRERIAALQSLVEKSPHADRKDSAALQQRHDLMRVKVAAYTQGAGAVRRLAGASGGLPALYGDVLVTHLGGSPRDALRKVDALIAKSPKYPYFHEIKGDILMRGNQPERAADAYEQAIKLETARSNLIRMSLGKAYLAAGKLDAALKVIQQGMAYDDRNPDGYQTLAQVYGALGRIGEAELATAEMHFNLANFRDAKLFATRAQQKLPASSADWLRAQDIINFKAP